jgi:leucyl-tRNA synthetase
VRLLARIWRACDACHPERSRRATRDLPEAGTPDEKALLRAVHVVAKSAVDETLTRRFHYNTTIAKLDELINLMTAAASQPPSPALHYAVRTLPILIAPFAPHVAEELWERLGHTTSVHLERYLEPDPAALAVAEITLVVQINGKVRARIPAPAGVTEDAAVELALAESNVRAHLDGKEIRKRVYVPDRLLNFVAA